MIFTMKCITAEPGSMRFAGAYRETEFDTFYVVSGVLSVVCLANYTRAKRS